MSILLSDNMDHGYAFPLSRFPTPLKIAEASFNLRVVIKNVFTTLLIMHPIIFLFRPYITRFLFPSEKHRGLEEPVNGFK